MKRHCWHYTGRGVTDGMAQTGTQEAVCCQCGDRRDIKWTRRNRSLKGHGRFWKEEQFDYDEGFDECLEDFANA